LTGVTVIQDNTGTAGEWSDIMTERRRTDDLTDQGKWDLEYGSKPDPIVALDDGDTWTLAEGCRLIFPTPEHGRLLSNGDVKVNDVQAVAEYNVDAMPELVKQLKWARSFIRAAILRTTSSRGRSRGLDSINAALDAAIEHEDGAK
tara:strand:- start:9 stop:446 length:438 start_codon:yes stop_codon:yes gene_type:complete